MYRPRRRYYRRQARWPGVMAGCALLCLLIVGLSFFHVWDRIIPQESIQANAQAAGFQQLVKGQGLVRRSALQEFGASEITDRLLAILDRQYQDSITAQGVAILDENGTVLYEKDADTPRSPASMTKLMTAIVMLDSGCLEDTVTVGELYSCYVDGSVLLYLEEGEEIAMRDLLAALMIESANDAAAAIAIHVAGSIEDFADLMNEKAKELGLANSHFVNPHGLTAEGHYTTPRDMAQIVRKASEYEILRELTTTYSYDCTSISPAGNTKEYSFISGNGFVTGSNEADSFQYICGKTGYTSAAGLCLAAAFASETGEKYFCVVMKSESHFADMSRTMNYFGERLDLAVE